MTNRFVEIYAKEMLIILTQANGWISHADATLRFKNRLFPRAVRTAGTVPLAEGALNYLVQANKIERRQAGKVRTYRVI